MLLFDHSPYKSAEDLVDLVNILKRKGNLQLREQTICHAPHCEDMIYDQCFDYYHDGQRVVINVNTQCCFRLNYLYVKNVPNKKYIYLSNWVKASMMDCIQEDYIKPFLLFMNGRCVPWDMISIIFTLEEYYILIESEDTYWSDMFRRELKWDTIILYDGIEYIMGGNPQITEETLFSFDGYGRFTTVNPYIVINNVGTMVSTINYRTDNNFINGNRIMDNDDPLFQYRLHPDTTFVFRNNLLDTSSVVRYDGTVMTINDGNIGAANDVLYCKIFINKNAFKSVDNIFRTDQGYIEQYIRDMNLSNIYPTYMDLLIKKFDLFFDKNANTTDGNSAYKVNFINAINKIMSYNSWLFNYVYRVNSNLDIYEVTGKDILERTSKIDNYFRIPRAHADGVQYCMIFVNGELYKYFYNTKYEFNFWAVPVFGIQPDDVVELWFFKNINNNVFDMQLRENPEFGMINEDYINDNLVLFAKETKEPIFQYPKYGMQHFPVPFEIEYDENKNARIVTDPFYCNIPLTAAYKNQFRMHSYVMDDEFNETIVIDLKDRFMYCNDYAKYMVFVNGRRISTEHYRLVLPVRETTPFSEFYLYITIPLSKGDRVDVFYLPCLMKDILVIPQLDEEGMIHIDKENINYPLSRDTYMVWINGKKVPKSYIVDIDATTMRIVKDVQTTDTVYLTKYIDDFDYLTPFFHDNTSIWSMIMKELSATEMTTLLGRKSENITNIEPSIYVNALPVLSIMWELIRDQYEASPFVDPTRPLVYDYLDIDSSVPGVGDVDDGGNMLIQSHDSERTDSIDRTSGERPWP